MFAKKVSQDLEKCYYSNRNIISLLYQSLRSIAEACRSHSNLNSRQASSPLSSLGIQTAYTRNLSKHHYLEFNDRFLNCLHRDTHTQSVNFLRVKLLQPRARVINVSRVDVPCAKLVNLMKTQHLRW